MYQLQHYILSEHQILLTKHNNINNQYLLSSGAGSNTFIPATIISALDEKQQGIVCLWIQVSSVFPPLNTVECINVRHTIKDNSVTSYQCQVRVWFVNINSAWICGGKS